MRERSITLPDGSDRVKLARGGIGYAFDDFMAPDSRFPCATRPPERAFTPPRQRWITPDLPRKYWRFEEFPLDPEWGMGMVVADGRLTSIG